MALSIFIDALPFSLINETMPQWSKDMNYAKLVPNIGYSSNLHWQLYCDRYPDEMGFFTDWAFEKETNRTIKVISSALIPFEKFGNLPVLMKKSLDRFIFKKNVFANIPSRFRKEFREKAKYLFFNSEILRDEVLFKHYKCILQDEGNKSLETMCRLIEHCIIQGNKDIFVSFSFVDSLGHKLARGKQYDETINKYMETLKELMMKYVDLNPNQGVLIASDHGMSTVTQYIKIPLEKKFGKQNTKTYIAYFDSTIMRIYLRDDNFIKISEYLSSLNYGHLLSDEERQYYGVTNKEFGDLIFILHDGFMFENNWFGKSLRRKRPLIGMHGFWPNSYNQQAIIMTLNYGKEVYETYNYREAYVFIKEFMSNRKK